MNATLPYSGQEHYELVIRGFRRRLPLIQVSTDTWIAYFDSLGDREFISHCARELTPHLRECDILFTSESKGIALVHEVAMNLGHNRYIVCRKELKPFMVDPICVEYRPITSTKVLKLCIDGRYKPRIQGKKIGIVDDIVSTRGTIDAMEELVKQAGGIVEKKVAILSEGSSYDDITDLGILPTFKKP